MVRMRIAILAVLVAVASPPLWAQDAAPDFDELWRVGSLWQVGDNRERVADARQQIIEAGDNGIKFALTKLHVNSTLEIRCLRAVFNGFGDEAYDDLVKNVDHDKPAARRNVAELLRRLDDERAGEALLKQAQVETDRGAKLQQLHALSKWTVSSAVPLIVELSESETERIRHRATALLGNYAEPDAVNRLVEMLDDDVFYVRTGAQNALKTADVSARRVCLARAVKEAARPAAEQNLTRLRLMLPVIATLADKDTPNLLTELIEHKSGAVRGDAAGALATWKQGAGLLNDLDVRKLLKDTRADEHDPFARTAIDEALERLTESDG